VADSKVGTCFLAGALSKLSIAIPNQKKGNGGRKLKSPFLPAPDLTLFFTANPEIGL
jgi:hypothetical protein